MSKPNVRSPKTLHELRSVVSSVIAGVVNEEVDPERARVALTGASRVIESLQAETRLRTLAFATKQKVPNAIPLDAPIFSDPA